MTTYIVGDIHITDPAAYQAHVPRALATIARFDGRVIAGGDSRVEVLEGDLMPERIFIIEFPTADAARRWYQSEDYQGGFESPPVSIARSRASNRGYPKCIVSDRSQSGCLSRARRNRYRIVNIEHGRHLAWAICGKGCPISEARSPALAAEKTLISDLLGS
jgi:uncharacterized protein (DUF1330 family)